MSTTRRTSTILLFVELQDDLPLLYYGFYGGGVISLFNNPNFQGPLTQTFFLVKIAYCLSSEPHLCYHYHYNIIYIIALCSSCSALSAQLCPVSDPSLSCNSFLLFNKIFFCTACFANCARLLYSSTILGASKHLSFDDFFYYKNLRWFPPTGICLTLRSIILKSTVVLFPSSSSLVLRAQYTNAFITLVNKVAAGDARP